MDVRTVALETPHGQANAQLRTVDNARAALVMGHGAAGGIKAPDLVAAAEVALAEDVSVALVEQPYRVAGRRSPPPARQLDAAWTAVLDQLMADALRGLPLIAGGRSMGGRVACRTAQATGAIAVLCLAFPLQPPQRTGAPPKPSRLSELDDVPVPTLIVQGEKDPFGIPPATPRRTVALVADNHNLKSDLSGVTVAVQEWLRGLLA